MHVVLTYNVWWSRDEDRIGGDQRNFHGGSFMHGVMRIIRIN